MLGFGERERAEELHGGHRGQPPLLLLLRATQGDRTHRQAGANAEGDAQAAVAAVQFHGDQPAGQWAHPGAAVAFDVLTDDTEPRQPPDERPGDLGPFPVPGRGRLTSASTNLRTAVNRDHCSGVNGAVSATVASVVDMEGHGFGEIQHRPQVWRINENRVGAP